MSDTEIGLHLHETDLAPGDELADAVLLIVAPDGVCSFTLTTRVKLCTPLAGVSDALVQESGLVEPIAWAGQVHPPGTTLDTNVVLAGMLSLKVTFVAVDDAAVLETPSV